MFPFIIIYHHKGVQGNIWHHTQLRKVIPEKASKKKTMCLMQCDIP